jgi:hypothetical protein
MAGCLCKPWLKRRWRSTLI